MGLIDKILSNAKTPEEKIDKAFEMLKPELDKMNEETFFDATDHINRKLAAYALERGFTYD